MLQKMRSKQLTSQNYGTQAVRVIPSLVDLCVQKAIENVRHIGYVGDTPLHLLERFLPHCSLDQLKHVEDSTEDRDLSAVTNKLWKNFYKLEFGSTSTNVVVERMKQTKKSFPWRELYEAKLKEVEAAQTRSLNRISQLYKAEEAKKQSRKTQTCTKVPPSSGKRCFYGGPGSGIGNTKNPIMKKAKLEFLNSPEVKNRKAMKKSTVYIKPSVSSVKKPSHCFSGKASASGSKLSTPGMGRFR